MAGRSYTRHINGPGNSILAEHVNELQVGLEEDDGRLDIVERNQVKRAPGRVCFTWDDGYKMFATIAQVAASMGQRHTFFVNSASIGDSFFVSPTDMQEMVAAGHEIGSHGVLHQDVLTLTAAQRAAHWDNDKATLEAIIGEGTVTSYAYPFGSRDNASDCQAYLRFDRARGISYEGSASLPFVVHNSNAETFLVGATELIANNAAYVQHVKDLIELASRSPITVMIYAHNFAAGAEYDTMVSVLQLAQDLDVPCVTYREAFPADRIIRDAGFEDPTLVRWPAYTVNGGSAASVATAPADGFNGTRALKLAGTATNSTAYVSQRIPIRLFSGEHNVSFRYKAAKTGGAGTAYVRVRWLNAVGGSVSQVTKTLTDVGSWTQMIFDVTPSGSTHDAILDFVIENYQGEVFVDHVHMAPRAYGAFG